MLTPLVSGRIEALLLATDPVDFYTYPVSSLDFDLGTNSIVGNIRHGGKTTLADIRTPAYQKNKDKVLNRQSASFVGAEDLDYIAGELGLDEDLALGGLLHRYHTDRQREDFVLPLPNYKRRLEKAEATPGAINRLFLAQCLGANMIIGDFTSGTAQGFRHLTRGIDVGPYNAETRKFSDATIWITRPNNPCIGPGKKIEDTYGAKVDKLAQKFVVAAEGRRGFVGMIAKGGSMSVGQELRFIPYGEA